MKKHVTICGNVVTVMAFSYPLEKGWETFRKLWVFMGKALS